MTYAEHLADYVCRAKFEDLSDALRAQLKIRVLDSMGCAIGAIEADLMHAIRQHIDELGGSASCTLIGGGKSAPDRAAFHNGALVRYLDFNDSYLAKGETCHPSDNLAPVLAASEYADASGRELLTALAVAYQVQCRLSDVAPVRAAGFDHTTQGSYAVAAGVSKALGLDREATANAIAIAGTALNALRVTRTGMLSNWKGLAYPHTAAAATFVTFLAKQGVTGPLEVFEGNKGFMDAIAGHFEIDWSSEGFDRVLGTILKRYNAEVHSQTAMECALQLKEREKIEPAEIEKIEIDTFDVAYHIIGGGQEGDKTLVHTKEEADHSLPYLVSVALLDGQVMPEQFETERIHRTDVQKLLKKVSVRPSEEFSSRFPREMPCRLAITLRDGRKLQSELGDYPGFVTRPMSWEMAGEKFERLAAPFADSSSRKSLLAAIGNLEEIRTRDFTSLLGSTVREQPGAKPSARRAHGN